MTKKKASGSIAAAETPADHPMFLKAAHGFLIKRAGWVNKTLTGDGEGGFVVTTPEGTAPFEPEGDDLDATDWVAA